MSEPSAFAAFDTSDSVTCRWAADLVHRACERHVADHSRRAYLFAVLHARRDGVDLDHEALYVGTLLHDVGLSAMYDGDARFEVRGANAVRSALLEQGWSPERAANVWDIIALHATTQLAAHKSPETCYANLGVSTDLRGSGLSGLGDDNVRWVLDHFPRAEFPQLFCDTLIHEVRTHVSSVRLSWLEPIAVKHVDGYAAADVLDALAASTEFR
jgi:hypothetical protein